jgi:hypothetical protein
MLATNYHLELSLVSVGVTLLHIYGFMDIFIMLMAIVITKGIMATIVYLQGMDLKDLANWLVLACLFTSVLASFWMIDVMTCTDYTLLLTIGTTYMLDFIVETAISSIRAVQKLTNDISGI